MLNMSKNGAQIGRSMLVVGCLVSIAGATRAKADALPTEMGSDRAPVIAPSPKNTATLINDRATRANTWQQATTVSLPEFDVTPYAEEDAIDDRTPGLPYRVGINRDLPQSVSPVTHGVRVEQADGGVTWIMQLESPDAQGLIVHFAEFELPEGAQLVISGSGVFPPVVYRGKGRLGTGAFWSRSIMGDTAFLEYQDPTGSAPEPRILIDEVCHIYRGTDLAATDLRGVYPCNKDVNCYTVDQTAQDSVGRMLFQVGFGFGLCTGALLNDADPNTYAGYFLTANHCLSTQGSASSLEIWWFYETDSCDGVASIGAVTDGAQLLETNSSSDFTFLRLNDDPKDGQGLAAWHVGVPSTAVRGIHHPGGTFKRYSEGIQVGEPPLCTPGFPTSHFIYNDWYTGITEGGSSGSPLFDSSWRVIGQLYGRCSFSDPECGPDGTSNPEDYNNMYGRFFQTYQTISSYLNTITPDDAYEDNDSLAQSADLPDGAHNLQLVDFDDYFVINACVPTTVTATATFDTGDMDLDLWLLTSGGATVDSSTGSTGSESVSVTVEGGTFLIRAEKVGGWGGDYTLTLSTEAAGMGAMADCLTGPMSAIDPGCDCFDFDNSGTVDLADFGALTLLLAP